ncbi:MAG: hypothetical protein ACRCXK_05445, partial [Wohlfahrtiimonas sp.]
MDELYKVIFKGEIQLGFLMYEADVKKKVIHAFKMDEQRALIFFSGKKVVLKDNVSLEEANTLKDKIQKFGLVIEIESNQANNVITQSQSQSQSAETEIKNIKPSKVEDASSENEEKYVSNELEQILKGDASSILVVDFDNGLAIKTLLLSVAVILVPILFAYITSLSTLFLLIPAALVYGLYLMLTNQAVFYASKQDLTNVSFIFLLPIGMIILLWIIVSSLNLSNNSIVGYIMTFIWWAMFISAFVWFGMKSANANVILNSGLNTYQLVAILFTKIFIFFLFLLALAGKVSQALGGSSDKQAAQTTLEYDKARDQHLSGLIGVTILSFLGFWFYKKSI